jgi:predicted RNA-binding Zn-ribbon protein involved in translation (DUF1610 family)
MADDIRLYPGDRSRFHCPECGEVLPVDSWTECQRCGAHLNVQVEVEAPGVEP